MWGVGRIVGRMMGRMMGRGTGFPLHLLAININSIQPKPAVQSVSSHPAKTETRRRQRMMDGLMRPAPNTAAYTLPIQPHPEKGMNISRD